MEYNPIDVQKHLKGVDYPAGKEDLASTAESNGAPDDLVQKLRSLSKDEFNGPNAVMAALKNE